MLELLIWKSQVDDPETNPLNGYGPYNAMQIKKLHAKGAINSGNYVWFGLQWRLGRLLSELLGMRTMVR